MKKYDYVLVGSGLYAGVWAYEAKKRGKTCLVVEKRDHIGGNCIVRMQKAFMCIVMARTFFIPVTVRCGTM